MLIISRPVLGFTLDRRCVVLASYLALVAVGLDLFQSIMATAVLLLQLMACYKILTVSYLILRCFIRSSQFLWTVVGVLAYAFALCAFVPPFSMFAFEKHLSNYSLYIFLIYYFTDYVYYA
jgi:hypothetical protein